MPRSHQPKKTNRYPTEFKSKAVRLSLMQGVQVKEVAKTLDIHPFMLSKWRKEHREGKIQTDKRHKVISLKKDVKEIKRVRSLEKEVSRLKQENALLKKWQRFLGEKRQNDISSSRETEKSLA